MTRVRFVSISIADTYDPKHGRFVSHVISTDTKGRRWERWDGLGESNGDSLIPSPFEPAKRQQHRKRRTNKK